MVEKIATTKTFFRNIITQHEVTIANSKRQTYFIKVEKR